MSAIRSHWDEVCSRVREHEDPFIHHWLDRLELKSATDGLLVLATPGRLYVEFIQENVEPLLLAHLLALTGTAWRVEYVTDATLEPIAASLPAPPPSPREPAEGHFRPDPKQSFASYIIGHGNEFAAAAAQNVADMPAQHYNPLFIFGGVGLGKTHLLNAIANRLLERQPQARIVYVSAEQFTNELIAVLRYKQTSEFRTRYREQCDVLLIDDVQFLSGKPQTQMEFFHTFNSLHAAGRQIVITADRYPRDIEGFEERLRSRFDWGLVADVQAPDTETKVAILRKKADEEGVELPSEVAFFIARYAGGNIRELEGTLNRLVAKARFERAAITEGFARHALSGYLQVSAPDASLDGLATATARHFGVRVQDLKGPGRSRQLVTPRQVAMYLARLHTGLSLPEIGRWFGGRDHTTVLHAVRRVDALRRADLTYRRRVDTLCRSLGLPTA